MQCIRRGSRGTRREMSAHIWEANGGFQMARDWAIQRLVRDYERLPQTVAGLPFLVFACLMLNHAVLALGTGP